ncbi:MAG: putative membrane protein YdjX (TVP38/TMEM64 family) [Myxococcota bacterium]|jgi:uncharacterized membrane protein YdjX (TVP38/TMEM64 family)
MQSVPEPESEHAPDVSWLLGRLLVALVIMGVCAWFLGTVLQGPIETLSASFVESFGVLGVFVGVMILDAIPGTFHEPLLILAYDGGIQYGMIVIAAGTASIVAGVIGWTCGRLLGKWPFVDRLLTKYRITPFMRKHGARAVAIAALTPFPYAITTWGAGAADVPLSSLLIGALFRYIKVALYLGIIVYGWSLGT